SCSSIICIQSSRVDLGCRFCLFLSPCYLYVDHRDLHSFPTRRSSDLPGPERAPSRGRRASRTRDPHPLRCVGFRSCVQFLRILRSEEHTSELQSRVDLVCRLLLEKKKMKYKAIILDKCE